MNLPESFPEAAGAPARDWLRWLTRPGCALGLLVAGALILRLPFVMHSFDEVDSSNFALGAIRFDVVAHQPHPPGQFYYVMLCQGMRFFVGDAITTLSLLSALFSSLALIPCFLIARLIFGRALPALAATALTAFSFGFWLTGLRPVSDPVSCFFLYGTVAALLHGLDRPGWFCAGMALCAFQLGIKQLSVYFLAPLVIVIGTTVLLKHGWRPALAGACLFAAVFLGWLAPTIRNAGGRHQFLVLSRRQQAETYRFESLVTHLTTDQIALHAAQNGLWLWGFPPLAAVMLALAVIGLGVLWRRGLRARLFMLFGLTTILYIFLVLSIFSKYYVYTAPVYCTFAAAGLSRLCSLSRLRRFVRPPAAFAAAVGLLILADLGATMPLLGRMSTFRSPVQAAFEYLVRQHGTALNDVDVITNHDGTVSAALRYFQLESGLHFADFLNGYGRVVPELNSGRQVYLLSFIDGGGSSEHLELLDTFVWDKRLRKILQAWNTDEKLFLYKVHGGLPGEYAQKDERVAPLLLSRGLDPDGWAGTRCDLILPGGSGAEVGYVRLQGRIPEAFGFRYPLRLTYDDPGQSPAAKETFTVDGPGVFDALLVLHKPPADRHLDVRIEAPASYVPAAHGEGGDTRALSWQLVGLRCSDPSQPMLFDYEKASWYGPESNRDHAWRWCHADGKIDVAAPRDGTLVINATLLSTRGGDHVDVLLDGAPVAGVDAANPGATPPQTFRVPLRAGLHTVTFHGRLPGEQPAPADDRLLAIGVQDLSVSLE